MMRSVKSYYYAHPAVRAILHPFVVILREMRQKRYRAKSELLRSLVESLSEDPVIAVKEFHGKFQLDASSHLFERMVINKQYEPSLVQCVKRCLQKSRDVVDVGANVGFFTVMFAKEIDVDKRVLAIEPTKNALKRLYRNINVNEVEQNVVVFEGVASDHEGVVELKTVRGKEEYSSLGVMEHPEITGEEYEIENVTAMPVDKLTEINGLDVGFMKVDVEGMEHVVFEGSESVLKTHRPVILSELSDNLLKKNGSSSDEVIRFINGFDYTVVDPIDPSIPAGSKPFGDILCFPNELGHLVTGLFEGQLS